MQKYANERIMKDTGRLFGKLFCAYDKDTFMESVKLFGKRFRANGFDTGWFKGKRCLDAGCGSGRYSIAISLLGARKVYGIDISKESIKDASRRTAGLKIKNIEFRVGMIEKIPFKDNSFDAVICSGVLMCTNNPEKALSEIIRVLKPGGFLYLLVYATGGVRWPLIQLLRPLAQRIGFRNMDAAVTQSKLPVNKRRTYLDDLFVPKLDFYTWDRIYNALSIRGMKRIKRWEKGRFDHEENLAAYFADLQALRLLFESGARLKSNTIADRRLFKAGQDICESTLKYVSTVRNLMRRGLTEQKARELVIGQGHHRILAWK